MKKGMNELAQEIHQNNIEKGFFEGEKNNGEMIALMHSELSEALEADRAGNWCTLTKRSDHQFLMGQDDVTFKSAYQDLVKGSVEEEMADITIRVLDFCAFHKIDIEKHIEAKMRYNSLRSSKHGKKY